MKKRRPKSPALRRAIAQVGSASELAKRLQISAQALSQWEDVVPPDRVLDVERITGIPRHELNPKIYPAPARARAS